MLFRYILNKIWSVIVNEMYSVMGIQYSLTGHRIPITDYRIAVIIIHLNIS
jgi:hypothetical protein